MKVGKHTFIFITAITLIYILLTIIGYQGMFIWLVLTKLFAVALAVICYIFLYFTKYNFVLLNVDTITFKSLSSSKEVITIMLNTISLITVNNTGPFNHLIKIKVKDLETEIRIIIHFNECSKLVREFKKKNIPVEISKRDSRAYITT